MRDLRDNALLRRLGYRRAAQGGTMSDKARDELRFGAASLWGSSLAIGCVVGLGLPWAAYLFGAVVGVLILAYRARGAR